ncbi:MAG: hypothetical protein NW208_03415 [Bryobacter sp.]|nr:hypothetical protein [Bryobacter sp.]
MSCTNGIGNNCQSIRQGTINGMGKVRVLLVALILLLSSCSWVEMQSQALPRGTHWNRETGKFTWYRGEVSLPKGYSYTVTEGVDTFTGVFLSPFRRVVVNHDIGGFAGAFAKSRKAIHFEEKTVQGARVWQATHKLETPEGPNSYLVAVTFPDSGCANFFLETRDSSDSNIIRSIAASYVPIKPVRNNDRMCGQDPHGIAK